jgi:hypothetical protein
MVHIEDMGSHFDAPIDTLWRFLQSPDDHGRSHKDRRNVRGEMDGEHAMRTSWEQDVGGQWVKVSNRVTMFPPVAMLVQSLEGPLAGSRFLFYYAPSGNKTGVGVVGDFQSPTIPAAQLQGAVLASLEAAFNDDQAALREFAARKK